MKTSELTRAALDWAVAQCEGPHSVASCYYDDDVPLYLDEAEVPLWAPSTDWAQGGPIIEREGLRLHRGVTGAWWAGSEESPQHPLPGPTPLIAAMRCYVASKLGDTVDIPEELTSN